MIDVDIAQEIIEFVYGKKDGPVEFRRFRCKFPNQYGDDANTLINLPYVFHGEHEKAYFCSNFDIIRRKNLSYTDYDWEIYDAYFEGHIKDKHTSYLYLYNPKYNKIQEFYFSNDWQSIERKPKRR